MLNTARLRLVFVLVVGVAILIGVVNVRLAAQGTIGSILGTVTDSSGSVVAGARVQVTNTGTNAIQSTTTDTQGRYRVPALPVGDYDVQGESTGFQTAVSKGIRLSAGADVVVDISLTVGQVTQTVVVEGEVAQVETTSSALSTVIQPLQMRELPLNGRNFEELVQLAPGVNVSRGSGAAQNAFTGKEDYWTVSGSRPNGQEILMDGTNIQQYQNRGTGSGILGTSLGVDAIGEFQMLTNTYGAQYGGNGSVMNSVTRSGTNAYHGSGYEFTRNSIFDAIPWPATKKNDFWKHQYGGTLGGPIKKDKMFFFVNYEGLRQKQSQSNVNTIPNALARIGIIPSTAAIAPCVLTNAYAVPAGAAAGSSMYDCGPNSPNKDNFAKVKPYLDLWPLGANLGGTASTYAPDIPGYGAADFTNPTDLGNGTGQMTVTGQATGHEHFLVGRFDWTVSQKDTLFARYLFDDAYQIEPFYVSWPMWPEYESSRNQYLTIGHKRIVSDTLVNSLNVAYTRTFFDIHAKSINPTITPGVLPTGSLNWVGDAGYTPYAPIPDGGLAPGSGITSLNAGISPIIKTQTRASLSEDLFWSKGAHSLRFGGSVTSSNTQGVHIFSVANGTWSFASLSSFLRVIPTGFTGVCNYYNKMPACTFNDGTPLPFPNDFRASRQWEFAMYVQDDWKVRSNLTLNLGLRYAPTTNPYDTTHQTVDIIPIPYGQTGYDKTPYYAGGAPPSYQTPLRSFFFRNPSLRTWDPRIGMAWAPFGDQKTSVRAGYGIFHAIMQCRDYCYGSWFNLPYSVFAVTDPTKLTPTFPRPFQIPVPATTSRLWGTNPYDTTPYMQQWNLGVQREIVKNTILTVAYVGSHGVHLIGQRDTNPPLPSGTRQPYGNLGAISLNNTETLWPNFPGYTSNLVFTSGGGNVAANGNITCTAAAGCTLGTADGAAIIDPATGKPSYAHIVQTTAASNPFTVVGNTRWNLNFAHMNSGTTDLGSTYHALQTSVVRRFTGGLQAQVSYTYSGCFDISSGNWSQEGGTQIIDAYRIADDRGPCVFATRNNLSTNGLYQLPFKGNRLFEGWQISGIFYYNSGGPFLIGGIGATGNDVGNTTPRANYVPNAPGCNGKPVNDPYVVPTGVFYTNPACFAVATVGETGNSGRNSLPGPKSFNVNASVQKNTKLTERFGLQIRVEGFNILNRRNFANPGSGFTQGGKTSAANVVSGTAINTFGQITGIVGIARQIQLGAKLTF